MSLMETSSILNGCPEKSFSSVYDLRKLFFGHPSRIDDVPIKLTQFCSMTAIDTIVDGGGFQNVDLKNLLGI